MGHEISSEEKRIKELETHVNRLFAALASVQHKLGQVAEDSPRQFQDDGVGRVFTRGQSVGVVGARTGNTPGTGTFRFLQLIGGAEYLLRPFASGDVTAPCNNDTGSPTVDNEYMDLVMIDGVWTCIVGDCVTAAPTRAPDPP